MTGSIITVGGKPFLLGGKPFLPAQPVAAPVVPAPGAPMPTASMSGWWDVGTLAAGAVYSIPDTSGNNKAIGAAVNIVPRRAGMLSGAYAESGASNYSVRQPVIDDYAMNANNITVGAGQSLAALVVWSRPNLRQPGKGAFSNAPVNLLSIGGTVVLQLAAAGAGSDALTLFPATAAQQAGSLPLRHTRGVLVQFDGGNVSVWLDNGTQLFSGIASSVTLGGTANLSFLPSAQMVFHEAAAWAKVLTSTERGQVFSYLQRWPMGARTAAHSLIIGQSNASNFMGQALFAEVGKNLSTLTGCLSSNLFGGGTNISGATVFSGQGLYNSSAGLILDGTNQATDPSTWGLGTNGNSLMAALDGMSADERNSLMSIFWFWSESMSAELTYGQKAQFTSALKRAFSLIRAKLGRTPAQLPIMVIDALPFPYTVGIMTHREAMADVAADTTQNVRFMLTNTQDAIGWDDSWDPVTGLESGPGNGGHRDYTGLMTYARRSIPALARATLDALVARGTPEPLTALGAGIPVSGGPNITVAHYEGTAFAPTGSVLVTVAHDGGNDLIVPLRAALGVGWSVMDGVSATVAGNPGAPGALILATACTRVSANQLRITLSSVPAFPAKAQLYCTYGTGMDVNFLYAIIGQGNAVTDNYATITPAAGWDMKGYLGSTVQPNYPVRTTPYGIGLT